MNQELLFVLAVFATYQSARCVGLEKGPAEAFLWVRSNICDYTQGNRKTKWICDGVCCPVCLAFWFGWLFASVLFIPWQSPILYVTTALALGGSATWIYKLTER